MSARCRLNPNWGIVNLKMPQLEPYQGPHVSRSATAFSTAFTACSHHTCDSTRQEWWILRYCTYSKHSLTEKKKSSSQKESRLFQLIQILQFVPMELELLGMAWVKSGKRKGAFTHTRQNEDRNAHMFLEIQSLRKNKCIIRNILLQEDVSKLETSKIIETSKHQKKVDPHKHFNSSK